MIIKVYEPDARVLQEGDILYYLESGSYRKVDRIDQDIHLMEVHYTDGTSSEECIGNELLFTMLIRKVDIDI